MKLPRIPTSFALLAVLISVGLGAVAARRAAPSAPTTVAAVSAPARRVPTAQARAEPDDWSRRWDGLTSGAACPTRTKSRADLLEELARTDPQRALALALAESNWLIRDQLRDATLRGWAATAPDAAGQWAMGRTLLGERMRCMSAVLTGAVEHPDDAVRIALAACKDDPQPAGDYGHHLINALVERTGDFPKAAEFARAAGMVDRQSYLVDSAYYQWAQHEPARVLAELASVTDPAAHEAALRGAIAGCADADARKLADQALALPEGADRSRILAVALPEWVGRDPTAALEWINRADPHPDFDKGLAALANLSSIVDTKPETALEITDGICDSAQRSLAKSNVFLQWARRDYEAAARYAAAVPNPQYREMFQTDLATVAAGRGP